MKCGLIVRREANFQLPRSFFGIGLASPLSFKAIIGEIRNTFFSLILRVGPCHKDHPFQSHELNCHNSVAHSSGLVMSHYLSCENRSNHRNHGDHNQKHYHYRSKGHNSRRWISWILIRTNNGAALHQRVGGSTNQDIVIVIAILIVPNINNLIIIIITIINTSTGITVTMLTSIHAIVTHSSMTNHHCLSFYCFHWGKQL